MKRSNALQASNSYNKSIKDNNHLDAYPVDYNNGVISGTDVPITTWRFAWIKEYEYSIQYTEVW